MSKLIRDPQLDDLVKELNREESGSTWPPLQVPSGNPLEELLLEVSRRSASDLMILAGAPPILRIAGRLVAAGRPPLTPDDVHSLLGTFLTTRVRERMEADGCADFSIRLPKGADDERRACRFRVNIHRQRGTLAAAVRALPTAIPTLTELNLPATLADLVRPARGLVLVCGPTGAGKTTTLAALVGLINANESRHIITIEDPVEYEHRNIHS